MLLTQHEMLVAPDPAVGTATTKGTLSNATGNETVLLLPDWLTANDCELPAWIIFGLIFPSTNSGNPKCRARIIALPHYETP